MPTLLDFDLRLERHGDAYRARVQRSPAGEAGADFSLPFSVDELQHFAPLAERIRNLRPAATPLAAAAQPAPALSPRDFGERLFAAGRSAAM
ncbi:MAG: hypothetical protein HC802_19460 [Caldilineaceae bacterium]|nr:hypothetical protein [Caldilineaceae bacterium]